MGVVLREAAHAEQSVEHARALIAIDRAQLAEAHRQLAVAVLLIRINQDVERAVHGLELVFGVIQLHAGEHVLRVEAGVPAGLPEIEARHMRGVDQGVSALQIFVAHPVFELLADDSALGMEEDQARAGQFLNAEQVQLFAQFAVVALLGLFQLLEVIVQVLLAEEGGAVDALQLLVMLVALPVSAGDGKQLESLDLGSVRHVRAAAEIDELRSQGVLGEDFAGALFDQLALHPGFGVLFESFFLAGVDALVGQVARLDLAHLLFDLLQIVGGEWGGAVEIVIEAVLDGRPDSEFGLGIQFQHGGCQQVGGGVAVDLEGFRDLYWSAVAGWRLFPAGGSNRTVPRSLWQQSPHRPDEG